MKFHDGTPFDRPGCRDLDQPHPEPQARLRDQDQVLRQYRHAQGDRRDHARGADRRPVADHADDDGHDDDRRPSTTPISSRASRSAPGPTPSRAGGRARTWFSPASTAIGARSPRSSRRPTSGAASRPSCRHGGTGEADIAPSIAPQDATDLQTDFSYFDLETTNFRIDVSIPPLNDVRVRKALNLAIDREAMVGTILSKDVVPATQFVVPSINGYNPNLKPWAFDPSRPRSSSARPGPPACRSTGD